MGFRPEPTTIKLNFKDTDLEGLVVVMKSVTVEEFNGILMGALARGEESIKANFEVMNLFLSRLVDWNLEDPETGEPVPPTKAGVDSQDTNLISRVIAAWQQGLTTVPTNSKRPSQNGTLPDRSAELNLGLGSLSQSPGS